MPEFCVETSAQQEFFLAVPRALSALHSVSSVGSSVAVALDSECELVPRAAEYIAKMQQYKYTV